MSSQPADKAAPATEGLTALDQDRAASLADEGGASAASLEAQPDEGRHPGVLPATSSGVPKEGPGILPGTPEEFGAAETQPLRVPRRPREPERRR